MEAKPLLPSPLKREEYPSLAKRGQGRFSDKYVCSIMDSLVKPSRLKYLKYLNTLTPLSFFDNVLPSWKNRGWLPRRVSTVSLL